MSSQRLASCILARTEVAQWLDSSLLLLILFWILDFRFWMEKVLPVGGFRKANVPSLNPNRISPDPLILEFLTIPATEGKAC